MTSARKLKIAEDVPDHLYGCLRSMKAERIRNIVAFAMCLKSIGDKHFGCSGGQALTMAGILKPRMCAPQVSSRSLIERPPDLISHNAQQAHRPAGEALTANNPGATP